MPPTLVGPQIHNDDTVAALAARVSDVCDALAGSREVGSEIETDVVKVRVREGDCGREDDGLEDGVVGKRDTDEFGAAVGGGNESPVGCENAACVEDPEAIEGVEDDGLDTYEVVLVVCTG
jgi:hypothetical protein